MYCRECGKRIDNDKAIYCPECGAGFSKSDGQHKNIYSFDKKTRATITKDCKYFVSCRFRDYFIKGFFSGLITLIITIALAQVDGSE